MNIKNSILTLGAILGLFTACHHDDDDIVVPPTYTVGEAINAIALRAGINEGGEGVQTRAVDGNHAGNANGGAHKPFSTTETTQLRLRMDGTWLGKGFTNNLVSKTTTATIGALTGNENKHNVVSFSTTSTPVEQLYWDDYGSADPANIDTPKGTATAGTGGRDKGLTIYGVVIEGESSAPAVSDWTALSWNVGAPDANNLIDQSGTNYWKAKDLLTSNNVTSATDGTYKFDDYLNDLKNSTSNSSNLLEFTHAMIKITVNLTAGEGFPGYETGAANAKFQAAPTVKLLGFNYTGTYNIETKTPTATAATTTDIKMHLVEGGASNNKAKYDALVFPGNTFSATIGASPEYKPTSATNILELDADGNIYKVTAAQLVKAIAGTGTTGTPVNGTLEQGKNYILKIIVNKTKIVVTATIKAWEDVEADPETPKINVVANVGDATVDANTKDRMPSFDFYLSDAAGANATTAYAKSATATKPSEGADGATVWGFDNNLYWPDHNTHYYMRGVSPTATTVTTGKIDVTAGDYNSATSPSNLLVGAPIIADNTMCGNPDHTKVDMSTGGICAREGKINLTFNYMMSQIEVRLTTATGSPTPANAVNLTNAKVEIVGGYTTGQVDIHTKTVATTGVKADFEVKHIAGENADYRHSAVVPQDLSYSTPRAETNLRFKITIYKNGDPEQGVDDIYYTDIYPIKKKDSEDLVAPNHKWESGVHYIYNLYIEKTAIKVTATITDWVQVDATDNVWF